MSSDSIVINGRELTPNECYTLRVAINVFYMTIASSQEAGIPADKSLIGEAHKANLNSIGSALLPDPDLAPSGRN